MLMTCHALVFSPHGWSVLVPVSSCRCCFVGIQREWVRFADGVANSLYRAVVRSDMSYVS